MSCCNRSFEPLMVAVFVALAAAVGVGLLSSCGYDGVLPKNILDSGGGGGGGGGDPASITAFSPTSAVVGTLISVTGTNFVSGDQALFTGMTAPTSVSGLTATSFQVTIPQDAYAGLVTIQRGGATSGTGRIFTIIPQISSVGIPAAGAGGLATVLGTGFNSGTYANNQLFVGSVNLPFTSVTLLTGDNRGQTTFGGGALTAGVQNVVVVVNTSLNSNTLTTNVAP